MGWGRRGARGLERRDGRGRKGDEGRERRWEWEYEGMFKQYSQCKPCVVDAAVAGKSSMVIFNTTCIRSGESCGR